MPLPKKPHRKGKQSRGNGHRAASKSAKNKSGEDNTFSTRCICDEQKSLICLCTSSLVVATDDSSDDEPLTKKKTPAKKPEKKGTKSSKSNGTNDKKAGGYIVTSSGIFYLFVFCLIHGVNIF